MSESARIGAAVPAWRHLRRHVMELILLVLCAVLAFRADGFFTTDNLLNVLRNVSMQGVIAFGMTMVIISGEIDLSVGSAVAFAGCMTAFLTQKFVGDWLMLPLPLAIALSILLTLAIGFVLGTF